VNRADFESAAASLTCKFCGASDFEIRDSEHHPGGGVWCSSCNRHQFWLGIDRAENHRPPLKRGTTDQVWAAWGETCSFCGLNEDELDFLGLTKTTQHCPPFKEAGHDGAFFIPLCSWCQQDSASRMKRLQSLVARLRERAGVQT
jgi:hypothetical protein